MSSSSHTLAMACFPDGESSLSRRCSAGVSGSAITPQLATDTVGRSAVAVCRSASARPSAAPMSGCGKSGSPIRAEYSWCAGAAWVTTSWRRSSR